MQVDAAVGQILAALDEAQLTDDTLLIFSSDNGPVWYEKDIARFGHRSAGELRGMKASSYEGGHRMPFLAKWPGRIKPGSVSDQTIVFSDLYATLAEMLGEKDHPGDVAEDSVSFLPWLLDAEKPPGTRPPIVHDRWTLRDGDWKLILPRKKEGQAELYNLRADRSEQHNLIEEQPARAQRMKTTLAKILENTR